RHDCQETSRVPGRRRRAFFEDRRAAGASKDGTVRTRKPMIGAMFAALALGTPGGSARPDVSLQPAVIGLKHTTSVFVTGITTSSLQLRLAGASTPSGRPAGWTSLRRIGIAWQGTIRAPARRGIY